MEKKNKDDLNKLNLLYEDLKGISNDYSTKVIPVELKDSQKFTQNIKHTILKEKEHLSEMESLIKEYEQLLEEFMQIVKIAEKFMASPVQASTIEGLKEEIQRHRKFFINLHHCSKVLESLENNLDSETKAKNAKTHNELIKKANDLLEQSGSRFNNMQKTASKWVVLDDKMNKEKVWLKVVHQRIPDLRYVTTTDYEIYIPQYQVIELNYYINCLPLR